MSRTRARNPRSRTFGFVVYRSVEIRSAHRVFYTVIHAVTASDRMYQSSLRQALGTMFALEQLYRTMLEKLGEPQSALMLIEGGKQSRESGDPHNPRTALLVIQPQLLLAMKRARESRPSQIECPYCARSFSRQEHLERHVHTRRFSPP